MKHKLMSMALILAILLTTWAPKSAYAQSQGDELGGLLDRLTGLTAALDAKGYTIVHIGVDKLKEGQNFTYSRNLYTGNDYVILGMGGVGVSDMDIKLFDGNDRLVDKDTSQENLALVEVRPTRSGIFKIQPSIYALGRGYSSDNDYFVIYLIAFKRS